MNHKVITKMLLTALSLLGSVASASTRYVDGVNGSDMNNCLSSESACKTIGHAVSLASSGDSIMVAAATYSENLTIGTSLTLIGSSAATTIIDGGGRRAVVTVSSASAHVTLSQFTIHNGHARYGGGISNAGTLKIIYSTVSNNKTSPPSNCFFGCGANGGRISNVGTLTINNTTISGNTTYTFRGRTGVSGGGIWNQGTLTVSNSTVSGNTAQVTILDSTSSAYGGGIGSSGTAFINDSTITGNFVSALGPTSGGGGIWNQGSLAMSNITVSGNGGGVDTQFSQSAVIQNSILADNGTNCKGSMTSKGYNLSSDSTCSLNDPGDLNNTDPKLSTLGYYGGPTQTIQLLSGSPAIDAGMDFLRCTAICVMSKTMRRPSRPALAHS
jgi:hypothetical protein